MDYAAATRGTRSTGRWEPVEKGNVPLLASKQWHIAHRGDELPFFDGLVAVSETGASTNPRP